MIEIEAIYIPTKEHVGLVTVDDNGETITHVEGKTEIGFQGPFANISWHTRCHLANEQYPNRNNRPNALTVPDIDVAEHFPRKVRNLLFIKRVVE